MSSITRSPAHLIRSPAHKRAFERAASKTLRFLAAQQAGSGARAGAGCVQPDLVGSLL
jgi:hypothetical protein